MADEDLIEARKELEEDFLWFEAVFAGLRSMEERHGFNLVIDDLDCRLCDIKVNLDKLLKRFDEQNTGVT